MSGQPHILVFGASGAIGGQIVAMATLKGWKVTGVARGAQPSLDKATQWVAADPMAPEFDHSTLAAYAPYDAVCWAQGMNATDSVYDVEVDENLRLYNANCLYILKTLQGLLTNGLLAPGSRLCVISSIWQNLARQNKLSYCMTKAALQGLVLSASADLARDGHLINAVLPGAVDTPMTRKNLKAEQIRSIASGTQFERLTTLEDVASLVLYLCSSENSGITGQFIAADLGWSNVRIV